MKVAFQGEHGAYSEVAVFEHFGEGVEALPCESFDDVFAAVSDEQCDCGLVPIENSLAGSIHRNYDLLLHNRLHVIGEHYLRVSHCLIGLPGVRLDEIRRVISHPQALAQCEQYLRRLPGVRVDPVYDTAGSVKLVREAGDRTTAAIASQRAAQLYAMDVLDEKIEDSSSNFTRFLKIACQPQQPQDEAKTSIVFALKNQPGALFRALSVFALRDIDLTKMESRPLTGRPWEYFFYIDLLGSSGDQNVHNALDNLEEYATFLRVLGSYPRHRRDM
ncbi:MAG: prephenate dehydratase [Chloroflexi bacterium]|jgi:prephenate dehydratase|nr:prephenate dehydratase [Anaerolineaceae bacterium]NMB87941.1 prephenate dehydratase [Chloroflexota bacterium]